jgi:hypothetical protein
MIPAETNHAARYLTLSRPYFKCFWLRAIEWRRSSPEPLHRPDLGRVRRMITARAHTPVSCNPVEQRHLAGPAVLPTYNRRPLWTRRGAHRSRTTRDGLMADTIAFAPARFRCVSRDSTAPNRNRFVDRRLGPSLQRHKLETSSVE